METRMKYIGMCLLLLLTACSDDWEPMAPASDTAEAIYLHLQPEGMPVIETRNGTAAVESDSRVDHVILYVFNGDGTQLLTRYQQDLEHPDLKVRVMLPKLENENETLLIHAVCNYHDLWKQTIQSVSELNQVVITIDQPDGAFNGAMVMHGTLSMKKADVDDKAKTNTIPLTRIAARVNLDLTFDPEIPDDKFYLTSIRLCQVPKQSWLVHREGQNNTTEEDAVYDTDPEQSAKNYFSELILPYETKTDETDQKEHILLQTYLFENRRGGEADDSYFKAIFSDNEEMWQTLKGDLGKNRYVNSSYLKIEGYYKSGNTTAKASYSIYLGEDNYKDFNVRRNHHYQVKASIKTCNKLDTRVEILVLGGSHITPSFSNPLDAHFNAVSCFGYTRNDGWELYVEDPDKHPWLEISFSSQYRPRIAGQSIKPGEEKFYAATRFEGKGALSEYFYVHTDEYIPENPAGNGALNNTLDDKSWRTGYIVLRDRMNGSTVRLEVQQRPAQVVRMPVKDLLGHVKFYNEYFIEYELEKKNLTWGFLQYGANPVMTSMINDRWDGLANTRRLYQEAIKIPDDPTDESEDSGIYWGAYNGYYTVDVLYPRETDTLKVINRIPDNHMIKYVLSKNRDRNGNGFIDYDEIVWYVPALDELAYLKTELELHTIVFQNSSERFHSSTPYLAGYSAEVPGRAFYVKMGQNEKAFAMRDRQYNVLCCRRKNAWTGDPDAGIGGNIEVNPDWNPGEEEVLPKD